MGGLLAAPAFPGEPLELAGNSLPREMIPQVEKVNGYPSPDRMRLTD